MKLPYIIVIQWSDRYKCYREHLIFEKSIFHYSAVPAREYYTPRERGQHYMQN